MNEPETDQQFEDALEREDYEVVEIGDSQWQVQRRGGGRTRGTMVLEAETYSDALFEAWNLVKP